MSGGKRCLSLSEVLSSVNEELARRFSPQLDGAEVEGHQKTERTWNSTESKRRKTARDCKSSMDWGNSPRVILDALSEDDWNSIVFPVGELSPYLDSVCSSMKEESRFGTVMLENYVQCRCAELPMRLQTEALSLRRYEEQRRRHMKKLIELSEFVTYCAPKPASAVTDDAQTHSFAARMQRCFQYIKVLEDKVIHAAAAKRHCSQRMVLMSAVVYALVESLSECEEMEERT